MATYIRPVLAVLCLLLLVYLGECRRGGGGGYRGGGYRGGGYRGSYRGSSYRSTYRSYNSYRRPTVRYSRPYRSWPATFYYYSYIRMYYYRPYYHGYYAYRGGDTKGASVCRNYIANDNGTYLGEFTCPMPFEPRDFAYCCGNQYEQYCCTYMDSSHRGGVIAAGVILGLLLIVVAYQLYSIYILKKSKVNPNAQQSNPPATGPCPPNPPQNMVKVAWIPAPTGPPGNRLAPINNAPNTRPRGSQTVTPGYRAGAPTAYAPTPAPSGAFAGYHQYPPSSSGLPPKDGWVDTRENVQPSYAAPPPTPPDMDQDSVPPPAYTTLYEDQKAQTPAPQPITVAQTTASTNQNIQDNPAHTSTA